MESEHFDLKTTNGWPKEVYMALIRHQTHEEWDRRPLMEWLYAWSHRFIVAFELRISLAPITVTSLDARRYGHFRPDHNCWGLKSEVAINAKYLRTRPPWQVLGTLCHELLHSWQQVHGRPGKGNYHNKEFRDKALSYGLIIDGRGVTDYSVARAPDPEGIVGLDAETPFRNLLAEHVVEMPTITRPHRRLRGVSTLKLWQCRCPSPQKARIGRGMFLATCKICGADFYRVDAPI